MFKFNQRRLASVKYLGELYMYRAVSASVIFDTLWFFISFGYRESIGRAAYVALADGMPAQGLPVPNRESPIDALNDFFRVRLVCTLLDTCGTCFDRGSLKRKLDSFLVVFQVSSFMRYRYLQVTDRPALCDLQERYPDGRGVYAQRHTRGLCLRYFSLSTSAAS